MRQVYLALLLAVFAAVILPSAHAGFTVIGTNTTVSLNLNTSASVTDILKVSVSNSSVSQYSQDRLALNLTLSQWQNLIGPALVEHIINPTGSVYHFNFLPGPLLDVGGGSKIAYLYLTYYVSNVTKVSQTAPRVFNYTFNNEVFNFEHAASGVVLGQNTTLTVVLPAGSKIVSVYPPPDSPASGFLSGYRNVTQFSWYSNEPLSKFTLVYDVQQSLEGEVLSFFGQIYATLGLFIYVIIAAAIAIFIFYTYKRANK